MREPGYYIRINGERVWLDPVATRHGELQIHEGSMGEQCDGCGSDIAEVGALRRRSDHTRQVVCTICDARYEVTKVEGRCKV